MSDPAPRVEMIVDVHLAGLAVACRFDGAPERPVPHNAGAGS